MTNNELTIISKNMLHGLAWPGPGHGLAMAWPGHGQVALGEKPVAQVREPQKPQDHVDQEPSGPQGHAIGFASSATWPWPGHGQVLARPDQATYFWKCL